jgi:hypothetical protein
MVIVAAGLNDAGAGKTTSVIDPDTVTPPMVLVETPTVALDAVPAEVEDAILMASVHKWKWKLDAIWFIALIH